MEKYRVVCSKPRFSDNIYVDIAPENGTTHEQIFFSREQLHKKISSEQLDLMAGSIYLQDDRGNINIDLPLPNVSKKRYLEYEAVMRLHDKLRKEIIMAYQTMRKAGKDTTLEVYSANMMMAIRNAEDEAVDEYNKRRQRTISYIEKHKGKIVANQSDYPQNPQQEYNQQQTANFLKLKQRRTVSINHRASQDSEINPIMRMKIKQLQYSGD